MPIFSNLKSEKNQLGIYWGKDSFSIVESEKGQPEKIATMRFDSPVAGDTSQKIPEGLRLTALFQQAIREKKFVSKKATLSLSAKDVIYRSFVIPFMQPNEVKNVVDFEATKYIPIKLDDLSYTFHAIPFNDGEQKSLRILFVAARKNILERYTGILQQSGIEVDLIEPASVSLMRVLQKFGHVPKQQATALVEIESDGGKIIITDKEVVQFVREFQSPVEGKGTPAENAKFFNDIRVSFNFYQRQNPQGKIDRIIALSAQDFTELGAGLGQEFKIAASSLTTQKIFKNENVKDVGVLSASGASIRERTVSSKNFDLTIKAPKAASLEPGGPLADWNLKMVAGSLAFSALIIYIFVSLANMFVGDLKKRSNSLKAQLGIYESLSPDKITELKDGITSKLDLYKDVRIKSEVTFYLQKIPQLLPSGAWLSSMTIDYYDTAENRGGVNHRVSKPAIGFEGYVYVPNPNDQIRLVNLMVSKMKSDKDFTKSFTDVILGNVKQDTVNNYQVTYFRISCK